MKIGGGPNFGRFDTQIWEVWGGGQLSLGLVGWLVGWRAKIGRLPYGEGVGLLECHFRGGCGLGFRQWAAIVT